jgi:hypothetical protein
LTLTIESFKPEVKEVDEEDMIVVIEYWPFRMKFGHKNGRTSLISFERFDGSLDEPDWIPPMYFNPSINLARAIFSSRKKKGKAQPLQARLIT